MCYDAFEYIQKHISDKWGDMDECFSDDKYMNNIEEMLKALKAEKTDRRIKELSSSLEPPRCTCIPICEYKADYIRCHLYDIAGDCDTTKILEFLLRKYDIEQALQGERFRREKFKIKERRKAARLAAGLPAVYFYSCALLYSYSGMKCKRKEQLP
jgi:hypothetical protein